MGTEYEAWIEYDISVYNAIQKGLPHSAIPEPFADPQSVRTVAGFDGLFTSSKDYYFINAISGWRTPTGIDNPYRMRGYPRHLHWQTRLITLANGRDEDLFGWLTLREIRAAIAHIGNPYRYIAPAAMINLEIMATLEKRFGVDRVRLIFETN